MEPSFESSILRFYGTADEEIKASRVDFRGEKKETCNSLPNRLFLLGYTDEFKAKHGPTSETDHPTDLLHFSIGQDRAGKGRGRRKPRTLFNKNLMESEA